MLHRPNTGLELICSFKSYEELRFLVEYNNLINNLVLCEQASLIYGSYNNTSELGSTARINMPYVYWT